jgi:hypothetical protein
MVDSSHSDSQPEGLQHVWVAADATAACKRGLEGVSVKRKQYVEAARGQPAWPFNAISWWDNKEPTFPSLYLCAFDALAIPAMSAECERICQTFLVFS